MPPSFTDQGPQVPYEWIPWLMLMGLILLFAAILLKQYLKDDKRYLYSLIMLFMSTFTWWHLTLDLTTGLEISLHSSSFTYSVYNDWAYVCLVFGFITASYFLIGLYELINEYLSYIKL